MTTRYTMSNSPAGGEALLDQLLFAASPAAYAEFLARLDSPPIPNELLRKTMQTPAPWDAKPTVSGRER